MVDTKSIIERKRQFVSLQEKKLKNHLKKNRKLMETLVVVNFKSENLNNIGVLNIIHEHSKDLDSESLIISSIDAIKAFCSKLNFESILNATQEVELLEYQTYDLKFEPKISIIESIENKILIAAKKLIEFQNLILEAA